MATAAASTDPAVKAAAIAALGGVGDGSTVPLLVKAIQDGGDLADTARHSLETVFADGVDRALIDTLKKTSDPSRRALYIEILDHRRAVSAVPVLLEEVAGNDANVRRRAIAALGNVASPDDVGPMIKGLLAIKDAGERDEAGRAVAAVCGRAADESKQADPVISAYQNAAPALQVLLVPVLGRVGERAQALALVREAVASSNEARRTSGYQALFNWPDSAVASDLAKLAETIGDKDLKALRRARAGPRGRRTRFALGRRSPRPLDQRVCRIQPSPERSGSSSTAPARSARSRPSSSPPRTWPSLASPRRPSPPWSTCCIAKKSANPIRPRPTRSLTRSSS